MAEISFNEEQYGQQVDQSARKPFLMRLVLNTGLVSTDQAAQYVLLCVAVALILLAFIIPTLFGGASSPKIPPGTIIINTSGTPPHLLAPTDQ